ncbi:MAG: PhzF family phenazine biosynthesis protein [Acidobacteria bacterium]|nr:PhzF family phenazine biosynthesis protein [Acidobacteriota bacterium]MBK8147267.1 PhzF family phenazine biosynthesis protein [Acidobacteriota bacterium]
MSLTIYQVDAFAKDVFKGNPAAICPLKEWLPKETMQAIAYENNLSETAFFVRNGDAFEIRWFTPTFEIDLCGHATLASAYVIFEILQSENEIIRFRSHLSGDLFVEKQGGLFVLDFPSRPPAPAEALPGLIEAIGKKPKEILRGRDFFLVYESESDIRAIAPNFTRLLDVPTHGVIVTAPGDDCDFVSRFFAPEVGVFEDPVTGSAHCNLIPFWAERLGKQVLFARQVSERGGELFCEIHGDRVKIGGYASLYLKGEIYV